MATEVAVQVHNIYSGSILNTMNEASIKYF